MFHGSATITNGFNKRSINSRKFARLEVSYVNEVSKDRHTYARVREDNEYSRLKASTRLNESKKRKKKKKTNRPIFPDK